MMSGLESTFDFTLEQCLKIADCLGPLSSKGLDTSDGRALVR